VVSAAERKVLWDAGFSLIPILRRGKRPTIRWEKYQLERASWDQVEAWGKQWPAGNIGIVTGSVSGLVVLDLDSEEAIAEARKRGLPVTPEVRTGKGLHVYFQHPGCSVRNRARLLPGMDIRGDGGFVVAPGSTHESGAIYEALNPISQSVLRPMPAWLMDLLSRPNVGSDHVARQTLTTRRREPAVLENAPDAAFDAQLRRLLGAPEGRRNHELNRTAFAAARIRPCLDKRQAFERMRQASRTIGLDEAEILPTMESGWEAGSKKPRGASVAEGRPDHLSLARMVIDQIGQEDILFANDALWAWTATGVWKEQDDRFFKQQIQRASSDQGVRISGPLVNGVLDVLKSEVLTPNHKFNQCNPEVVNCLNGELELVESGWQLVPHRRDHFRTTQIPIAYDPNAQAPAFMAFLDQAFRDDRDKNDKVQAVLELMGYSLMAHARHEKFVILIGPGANGKSVLLSVLEALCGSENVAGVQPSQFDRTFQRAHLDQKLANIVTELKQGEIIADAELKAITSGEASTVEHKFRNPFVMHPFATCWFGANHMPHTRDFSDALFRRATILTFNRVFASNEQDPLLKDKLRAELPGILNAALDAYAWALIVGFTNPSSAQDAKDAWRQEADQAAQFVEDSCVPAPDELCTISEMFDAYRRWAADQGISKVLTKKGLRERLTRLGFGDHRTAKARHVVGLKLTAWCSDGL
jgi:P4 family phage/plasmid primase-like protien